MDRAKVVTERQSSIVTVFTCCNKSVLKMSFLLYFAVCNYTLEAFWEPQQLGHVKLQSAEACSV